MQNIIYTLLKDLEQLSGGAYRHSGSFSIVISYRIFAII